MLDQLGVSLAPRIFQYFLEPQFLPLCLRSPAVLGLEAAGPEQPQDIPAGTPRETERWREPPSQLLLGLSPPDSLHLPSLSE